MRTQFWQPSPATEASGHDIRLAEALRELFGEAVVTPVMTTDPPRFWLLVSQLPAWCCGQLCLAFVPADLPGAR